MDDFEKVVESPCPFHPKGKHAAKDCFTLKKYVEEHSKHPARNQNGAALISYDPSDNSYIVSDKDLATMKPAERKRYLADRSKFLFESKVAKSLRAKKGIVEVQVWLRRLDSTVLAQLKKLGFKTDAQ